MAKRDFFRRLGPGIVTGAADDDPSGIGTYTYVGATAGYGFLCRWMCGSIRTLMDLDVHFLCTSE